MEEKEMQEERKENKAWKIVKTVLTSILLAVLAFLVVLVGWLAIDKFIIGSPVPSFAGCSQLTVVTGSMSGTIEEGDVIFIQKTDDYKIGDIVTYLPEGYDVPTTHRIIGINEDGTFITRGDANNVKDSIDVSKEMIVGEVVGVIPRLGIFFQWLQLDGGWLYLLVVILIVILGVLALKFSGKADEEEPEPVAPTEDTQNEE